MARPNKIRSVMPPVAPLAELPPLPDASVTLREAGRGRPPKWLPILRLFLEGTFLKAGPYNNEKTASVTAANWNRQMREQVPAAFAAWLRFRAKGLYVRLRRVQPR